MPGPAVPGADPGASDADLVQAARRGEVEAFGVLVDRYQRPLYGHALAIVLDHDAAADAVQDGFVRAYTRLGECRDGERFRGWMFQIVRNLCFDYMKDVRRRTVPLDAAGALFAPGRDPEQSMEQARAREDLVQALAGLPPRQREAFIMHYVQGIPYERMAELLHTSVSALKMRALRARETLAASLHDRRVTSAGADRLSIERG